MEDFVDQPNYYLEKIANLSAVSNNYKDTHKLSIKRADNWKNTMDKNLRKTVEKKLGEYFSLMDYEF